MKNILIITMLLGALYAVECEDYNLENGTNYNCDCNEDTWQEYYNSEGNNMQGCWLYEADLQGAYLYSVNLSGANLEGAILSEADLTGANLIDANLSGADLYQSTFIYALLIRANFEWTYLYQVDLVGANLSCANLSGAYFYLTNLTNTIWDECGITDGNGDGYDDVSYDAGAMSGDLNLDGTDDILDVVTLINNILLTP